VSATTSSSHKDRASSSSSHKEHATSSSSHKDRASSSSSHKEHATSSSHHKDRASSSSHHKDHTTSLSEKQNLKTSSSSSSSSTFDFPPPAAKQRVPTKNIWDQVFEPISRRVGGSAYTEPLVQALQEGWHIHKREDYLREALEFLSLADSENPKFMARDLFRLEFWYSTLPIEGPSSSERAKEHAAVLAGDPGVVRDVWKRYPDESDPLTEESALGPLAAWIQPYFKEVLASRLASRRGALSTAVKRK
jgi:hypothetical protein